MSEINNNNNFDEGEGGDFDLEFETRLLAEIQERPLKVQIPVREKRATNLYIDDDDLNEHHGSGGGGEPDFTNPTVGPILTKNPERTSTSDDEDDSEAQMSGDGDEISTTIKPTTTEKPQTSKTQNIDEITNPQIITTTTTEKPKPPTTNPSTTNLPKTTNSAKTTNPACIDGKCPPDNISPDDVGKYFKNHHIHHFSYLFASFYSLSFYLSTS